MNIKGFALALIIIGVTFAILRLQLPKIDDIGSIVEGIVEDNNSAHRIQNAIPAGEPIFARVPWPYLFNFKRNPIYVVDWPYGNSPPLGCPGGQVARG